MPVIVTLDSPDDVDKFVKETGSVVGYPGSKAITNAELLAMKVTVLAPCAMELQITAEQYRQQLLPRVRMVPLLQMQTLFLMPREYS